MIRTSLLIFALSISLCAACSTARSIDHARNDAAGTYAVNINSATAEELKELPGIGETLAARIVSFRQVNGPFRRVEHLMLVDGISEKKFRTVRSLIRAQ